MRTVRRIVIGVALATMTLGFGTSWNGVGAATAPPSTLTLHGTVRDFEHNPLVNAPNYNPDFENANGGDDHHITTSTLGMDGTPVYDGVGSTTTHNATDFNMWYHDTPNWNIPVPFDITASLISTTPPTYRYSTSYFFPIDNAGWNGPTFANKQLNTGDDAQPHNFSFTYQIHTTFTFNGGETFSFSGDDDVFVFLNKHKVVDLGGIHTPETGSVTLDNATATSLGMTTGNTYDFDFFFAERHTTGSNFTLTTSIALQQAPPPPACAPKFTPATTLRGNYPYNTTLSGNTVVDGATFGANVIVTRGANVFIRNASIAGSLSSDGAGSVALVSSTVRGGTSIVNTSGFTLLGQDEGSCTGNSLQSVSLYNNTGGLEASNNTVAYGASFTSNKSNGATDYDGDTGAIEIEGNRVGGNLACSSNSPTQTNDGVANIVNANNTCGI